MLAVDIRVLCDQLAKSRVVGVVQEAFAQGFQSMQDSGFPVLVFAIFSKHCPCDIESRLVVAAHQFGEISQLTFACAMGLDAAHVGHFIRHICGQIHARHLSGGCGHQLTGQLQNGQGVAALLAATGWGGRLGVVGRMQRGYSVEGASLSRIIGSDACPVG